MRVSYIWLVPLIFVWPVLHIVVFALRFGRIDGTMLGESAIFLPMGLIGGVVLIECLKRAPSRRAQIGAIAGYVIATPVAFTGSLLGGLIVHPLIGTLIAGAGPLVVGTLAGFGIGRIGGSVTQPLV